MPRPTYTPWGKWNGMHPARLVRNGLTFVEVNAIRKAHATGRFSKASLARIYDTTPHVIARVIQGIYRYHREE